MAIFNNAVLTDTGALMLAQSQLGNTLYFTRVGTGSGVYEDKSVEALKPVTALKSPKQSFPLNSRSIEGTEVTIKAVISNEDLRESYYLNELALFAKVGENGAEGLFCIAIIEQDNSLHFDAYTGGAPVELTQGFTIATSNTASIQMQYSSMAYALAEDLTRKQNNDYWVTYTLLASAWENNTYDLTRTYPSDLYDIVDALPVADTTPAMRKAWIKADCGGHHDTNVIVAQGTVPTIDIIIGLCIRPKEVTPWH